MDYVLLVGFIGLLGGVGWLAYQHIQITGQLDALRQRHDSLKTSLDDVQQSAEKNARSIAAIMSLTGLDERIRKVVRDEMPPPQIRADIGIGGIGLHQRAGKE